jgi:shikimate kinase
MAIVILTGFMATGKTSVGRRLAARLGCGFVDTDDLIEQREGRTIAQIFADRGEPYFRSVERQVIADAAGSAAGVLATGGGAMVDAENLARLRAAGPIVCLVARPEVILERAVGEAETRPLLAGEDPRQRIEELLGARQSAYSKADLMIDTSARSLNEVVDEVTAFLRARRCEKQGTA